MSNYLDKDILEINKLLKEKKIKPIDLVLESFKRIEDEKDLNTFITLNKEEALKKAEELEDKEVDNLLFGIPIAIKDNICTKNLKTTGASKMLENFIPIYDATVIEKINDKNMIIIGKTNMDEFAMGGTSRTSYFGVPLNPWNKNKITGGSSGGSASSVANRLVFLSLGSDTGGSIRQPSSLCGVVGMKPTYGRVSRYGMIAFASSLDQIGPISKNVYENALLLSVISGKDEKDLTTDNEEKGFTSIINEDIKGMKIAVPNYFVSDIISKEVRENFEKVVKMIKDKGATVEYIDIKYLEHTVTLYEIIALAEASSNLSRYDGIKYGYSNTDVENLDDLYKKTRSEGFGEEVKRRIMVGSFVLSGKNSKEYYDKALKLRNSLRQEMKKVFLKYDLLITPATTDIAMDIKKEETDPRKTFLNDVLTIFANMTGLPALSLPIGFSEDMPVGMQIVGNAFDEKTIYKLANNIEKELDLNLNPKGDKHE